jgi:quercetin dioxygenase-like cupin family protein
MTSMVRSPSRDGAAGSHRFAAGRDSVVVRAQFLRILSVVLMAAVALTVAVTRGQQLAPGPVPRAQSTFEPASVPIPVELVQAVLDFPVGAVVPPHVHGGAAYITIIEGALMVEGPDGARTYQAGDTLMEQPGYVYAAATMGDTPASLVVTYLIPKGAPVTTVVGP